MTATWFLIVYFYACTNNSGGDPGIMPGNCYMRETRVAMPSLEICRSVRAVNAQSKCMSEDFDK